MSGPTTPPPVPDGIHATSGRLAGGVSDHAPGLYSWQQSASEAGYLFQALSKAVFLRGFVAGVIFGLTLSCVIILASVVIGDFLREKDAGHLIPRDRVVSAMLARMAS